MATLRNVNPLGEVDVPLLGRTLAPGEVFEVSASVAEVLLAQPDNYQPVTKKTATTAKEA